MRDERLWRGGGAGGRALLAGLLAAPAALVVSVAALGLAVGASLESDRGAVLRFAVRYAAMTSYGLTALYGLPVFAWLARRDRAGLVPCLAAGAAPGLLFGAWLAAKASGLSAFTLFAAGSTAACGAFTAAVFWFVVRSVDRS